MIKRRILKLLGLDGLAEDIAMLSVRLHRAELEAARLQGCIRVRHPHDVSSQSTVAQMDRMETEPGFRLSALERNVDNLRATLYLPVRKRIR